MTLVACESEYSEGCHGGPGDTVVCDDATPSAAVDPQTLPAVYLDLSPSPLSKNPHPYVTGKIVIVDKKESGGGQVLSPGQFNIAMPYWIKDGQLLAEISNTTNTVVHPDEVGTVVWLECSEALVGTYNTGAAGYETDCTATVIDKAKNLIVGKKHFAAAPLSTVGCSAGGCDQPEYGGLDAEALAHYLEGLPRNPIW